MSLKRQIELIWQAAKQLPYKWQWAVLLFCSMLLFSWWDEIAVWGVGIAWKWQVIPAYYAFEYGILVPLTIWLGLKTYHKLNLQLNIGQLVRQITYNSLPLLIWRTLRKFIRRS